MDIPILLLKTRTQPNDTYEEFFSSFSSASAGSNQVKFKPIFIPVLEHTPNEENLGNLEELLRSGKFKEKYGGMIFTSQRAVEGWRGVVERVDGMEGCGRGMVRSQLSSHPYISLPFD